MGADVSLIPSWEFNFLNYYSTQFTSEWENGITSDTISLNLTESQFIDVTFSNCSQTYTDSIWVEVYNTPNISAGNDTTACLGGLFSLTASGGDSYTWTPSIFNGVPFTVDSAATFIVQGVDSNGCSATDSVYISIIDPTITADQTAFCLGDSTALSINTNGNSCGNLTGSLQNGLKGWWPFCGNANDESGNGNNGTVNGATLAADRFGNSNQAYSLDGQNDDIRITLNSINNNFPSESTITCNAWVKTSDLNGPLMAFRGGNTTFNYNIGTLTNIVTSPGKIGMLIRDDQTCCGSGNNIFGSSIADNNWHMVTMIRDGSNNGIIKLYVNTLLVATSAAGQNGSLTFNAAKMSFGSEQEWITTGFSTSTDQEYLNGNLDDIGIWNRALTQQEIESLYNQENLTNLWSDGTTDQSSIQVQPMQTTTYSVTVSDGLGSCTDSITIQVNNPQINAGNALSICEGDSTTLTATGASTYAWNNGVVNGQAFVPTVEGLYSVVGTDTLGCSNSDTLFLDLLQPTSSSISPVNCVTFTAPDGAIYTNSGQYVAVIPNNSGCDSTISINLTINSTSTGTDTKVACDSYTWIDGNTYTSSTNSATYVLQNANGCDSTVALNLTINKLNGLNAGNDINACEGDNITLSATGATSYNWTGVVSNGIPFVPSVGTTIYTVTGTDDNGCTATDALTVLVEYCLDIPGGISPNGDNSNDTWTINGLDQYPDAKVYVFDRWGQKVFSGDATNPTWNGTYEGKELPTADYYYIIELGNGEKFNGVVTLKK
jgi:gliding motility-associated-like protein